MSRNNGAKGSKLQELRLNLSRSSRGGGGPSGLDGGSSPPRRLSSSSSSSTTTPSPPSSCVSSEGSPEAGGGASGMILAGCPRCMMYVMLSREDPKCPKCHSTVLLDFNDAAADPRQAGAGKSKGKHRG
ncbi:protein GL2-INTERACTING REPRESSOR 1-like [Oryza brachyantha]|uniref:protein GL2-INTERACTING REPRESSOR 1-like n=1 Tax=Oryza brachyantha TaxID=4533 RepID=UPI001ADC9944|nr:protein GL2-INTERACTING REPRESSOR 1-like [Oryza brachyantha]